MSGGIIRTTCPYCGVGCGLRVANDGVLSGDVDHPANAGRLRSAADPRVTVFECALGSAPGSAQFSSEQGVASVLSATGDLITRLETTPAMGTGPGQFIAPHGLATDSRGDIYVAEVSVTGWPQVLGRQPMPRPVRSLQKLVRVTGRS